MAGQRSRGVALHAAVFLGAAVLAFVTYRSLLDLAFIGWDTYPM